MSKPADPYEVFRSVLSVTTASLSGDADVEVKFTPDGGRISGDSILLNSPPRRMTEKAASLARGEADTLALTKRYHDETSFMRLMPKSDDAKAIYEAAERARIESIGANAMDGVAENLTAALEERCDKAGYQRMEDGGKIPQSEGVEFLLREKLTGQELPEAAKAAADHWRDAFEKNAACLENISDVMGEQEKFAKVINSFLKELGLGEEETSADDEQDQSEDAEEDLEAPENEDAQSDESEGEEESGDPSDSDSGETEAESETAMAMEAEMDMGADDEAPERDEDTPPVRPNFQPGDDRLFGDYKPFTEKFDEIATAETLCDAEELTRLRGYLDTQLQVGSLIWKREFSIQRV